MTAGAGVPDDFSELEGTWAETARRMTAAGDGVPNTRTVPITLPAVCICCGEPSDADDVMCGTCGHPIFEMWADCKAGED